MQARFSIAFATWLVVLLVAGWLYFERDPAAYFDRRQADLQGVELEARRPVGPSAVESLTLTSSSGLVVRAKVRRPVGARRAPAIVILGGHRTGRDAVDLVHGVDDIVVASLSYPYEPERLPRGWRLVGELPGIRRALFDTPPAVSLLVDHLVTLPEVDASRIELAGVSLGAPLACVAGGREKRFRRVWAIHGGGDPALLLDHNLKDEVHSAWLRRAAVHVGSTLVHGLEPEEHVGAVSPRPLVLINADGDARIPRGAVEVLFERAAEPKEMVWLPGGHIRTGEPEQIAELVARVAERVRDESLSPVAAGF